MYAMFSVFAGIKNLAALAGLSYSLGWALALLVLQDKAKRRLRDFTLSLALLTQALLIAEMIDTIQMGEIPKTLTTASSAALSFVVLAFRGLKRESPEIEETAYVVATYIFKMEFAYIMGIPRGAAIFCFIKEIL